MNDLTVYIVRSSRNEEDYAMFMEAIDCLIKHFSTKNVYVIRDNESINWSSYDSILETQLSIKFITSEFNGLAEWLPFYYHWKNQPTKYFMCIHDSFFFQKPFDMAVCLQEINLYGVYPLSYIMIDYSNEHHRQAYDLFKQYIPATFFSKIYLDGGQKFRIENFASFGAMVVSSTDAINKVQKKYKLFDIMKNFISLPHRVTGYIIEIYIVQLIWSCYSQPMKPISAYGSMWLNHCVSKNVIDGDITTSYTYTQYLKYLKGKVDEGFFKIQCGR